MRRRNGLLAGLLLLCWPLCTFGFAEPWTIGTAPKLVSPLQEADQEFNTALAMWGDGKSAVIEALLTHALTVEEAELGPDNPQVGSIRERLGALYYNRGQYPRAEAHFRRAMAIFMEAYGEQDRITLSTMGDLGATLREEGRYAEAQAVDERSLALRRKYLPDNDLQIAGALNNLGRVYLAERRYADARKAFEESLRISRFWSPKADSLVQDDEAVLKRVEAAENAAFGLLMAVLLAGIVAVTFTPLIAASTVWAENRYAANPPLPPPQFVLALRPVGLVMLYASVVYLGIFFADQVVAPAVPSGTDAESIRMLTRVGSLGGVWLSSMIVQLLTNGGRQWIGLPRQPLVVFRTIVSQLAATRTADSVMTARQNPVFFGGPGLASWFAAQEHRALTSGKAFRMIVTPHFLCGARIQGLAVGPMGTMAQMFDPTGWTLAPPARVYDRLDPVSDAFLRMDPANFQIGWHEIASLEIRPGKAWGMGNVPQSGRLVFRLKSGDAREFVLLGRQDGEALKQRLEQMILADAPSVGT